MRRPPGFALATLAKPDGEPFAALVCDKGVTDLALDLGASVTVRKLLDDWDASLEALEELAAGRRGPVAELSFASLRPLPPFLPVGQVFQAGANYRSHVLELMAAAERRGDDSDGTPAHDREAARRALDERARDGSPFVFLGSAHAIVGATDDVLLPPEFEQHDWELELGVVIGRHASRVPREAAFDAVAGYTMCNDITMRDALVRADVPGGIDWLAAKNAPTFLPTGPLLVPAKFVDPTNLRITLRVNGTTMQDATTADIMFDVPRLIEYTSAITELRPGDLLLTGSPAGNGASHGVFLSHGDVIEGAITGLGVQRNRCVAVAAPTAPATPSSVRP
jgi:2-keto-4-pentenoate hydratase/2-oxohepta-3-ene-1,7-dioic acid hydratase in catechol pathway